MLTKARSVLSHEIPRFRRLALHNTVMKAGADPLTCDVCGRTSDPLIDGEPRLSWTMTREHDVISWVCPHCTSEHVRSMEAKLDAVYW